MSSFESTFESDISKETVFGFKACTRRNLIVNFVNCGEDADDCIWNPEFESKNKNEKNTLNVEDGELNDCKLDKRQKSTIGSQVSFRCYCGISYFPDAGSNLSNTCVSCDSFLWDSISISEDESYLNVIPRNTFYVFNERYLWHFAGNYVFDNFTQPTTHFEGPESKRRLHNLLELSGLFEHIRKIEPKLINDDVILKIHSQQYLDKLKIMNIENGGNSGDCAVFSQGGLDIARLAASGCISGLKAVMKSAQNATGPSVNSCYVLCRPPGHHAVKNRGMGFCMLNNIAITAQFAIDHYHLKRVAIIDYDVHHGNGTESSFYGKSDVLFISLHQDRLYPLYTGGNRIPIDGFKFNINIPLPAGSGSCLYREAFDTIVMPAIYEYKPELILVSSGFDASFLDPLGGTQLISDDFRYFTRHIIEASTQIESCKGRIVFCHEGGYSDLYVPFCGLAVLEELSGRKTKIIDNFKEDRNLGVLCQCTSVPNKISKIKSDLQQTKTEWKSALNITTQGASDPEGMKDVPNLTGKGASDLETVPNLTAKSESDLDGVSDFTTYPKRIKYESA